MREEYLYREKKRKNLSSPSHKRVHPTAFGKGPNRLRMIGAVGIYVPYILSLCMRVHAYMYVDTGRAGVYVHTKK